MDIEFMNVIERTYLDLLKDLEVEDNLHMRLVYISLMMSSLTFEDGIGYAKATADQIALLDYEIHRLKTVINADPEN